MLVSCFGIVCCICSPLAGPVALHAALRAAEDVCAGSSSGFDCLRVVLAATVTGDFGRFFFHGTSFVESPSRHIGGSRIDATAAGSATCRRWGVRGPKTDPEGSADHRIRTAGTRRRRFAVATGGGAGDGPSRSRAESPTGGQGGSCLDRVGVLERQRRVVHRASEVGSPPERHSPDRAESRSVVADIGRNHLR